MCLMTFIIDANILFSAFIIPAGIIGSFVFGQENIDLIAPLFLAKEFNKHKGRIAKAASITENQIEEAF